MKRFITQAFFTIVPLFAGVLVCFLVFFSVKNGYLFIRQKLYPAVYTYEEKADLTLIGPKNVDEEVLKEEATASAQDSLAFDTRLIDRLKLTLPRQVNLSITSKAYLAGDLQSGQIIMEKDRAMVQPIASITKLVTSYIAKELIDDEAVITITAQAQRTEGDTGKLRAGEKIKAGDLHYPLLMVSSNDAAEAFAIHYGREKFLKAMNETVLAWGATKTHFADPSGLSPQNTSTPEDLLKIVQTIYKQKREVINISQTRNKVIKNHVWVNGTHFLNLSSYIGGKNGYTEEADRTAVSIFSLRGKDGAKHPVAVIVLQSSNRDNDVLSILKYLDKYF